MEKDKREPLSARWFDDRASRRWRLHAQRRAYQARGITYAVVVTSALPFARRSGVEEREERVQPERDPLRGKHARWLPLTALKRKGYIAKSSSPRVLPPSSPNPSHSHLELLILVLDRLARLEHPRNLSDPLRPLRHLGLLLVRKELLDVAFLSLELAQLDEEVAQTNLEPNGVVVLFSKAGDEGGDLGAVRCEASEVAQGSREKEDARLEMREGGSEDVGAVLGHVLLVRHRGVLHRAGIEEGGLDVASFDKAEQLGENGARLLEACAQGCQS